eukprot:91770_1
MALPKFDLNPTAHPYNAPMQTIPEDGTSPHTQQQHPSLNRALKKNKSRPAYASYNQLRCVACRKYYAIDHIRKYGSRDIKAFIKEYRCPTCVKDSLGTTYKCPISRCTQATKIWAGGNAHANIRQHCIRHHYNIQYCMTAFRINLCSSSDDCHNVCKKGSKHCAQHQLKKRTRSLTTTSDELVIHDATTANPKTKPLRKPVLSYNNNNHNNSNKHDHLLHDGEITQYNEQQWLNEQSNSNATSHTSITRTRLQPTQSTRPSAQTQPQQQSIQNIQSPPPRSQIRSHPSIQQNPMMNDKPNQRIRHHPMIHQDYLDPNIDNPFIDGKLDASQYQGMVKDCNNQSVDVLAIDRKYSMDEHAIDQSSANQERMGKLFKKAIQKIGQFATDEKEAIEGVFMLRLIGPTFLLRQDRSMPGAKLATFREQRIKLMEGRDYNRLIEIINQVQDRRDRRSNVSINKLIQKQVRSKMHHKTTQQLVAILKPIVRRQDLIAIMWPTALVLILQQHGYDAMKKHYEAIGTQPIIHTIPHWKETLHQSIINHNVQGHDLIAKQRREATIQQIADDIWATVPSQSSSMPDIRPNIRVIIQSLFITESVWMKDAMIQAHMKDAVQATKNANEAKQDDNDSKDEHKGNDASHNHNTNTNSSQNTNHNHKKNATDSSFMRYPGTEYKAASNADAMDGEEINNIHLNNNFEKIRHTRTDTKADIRRRLLRSIRLHRIGMRKKANRALHRTVIANPYLEDNWNIILSKFPSERMLPKSADVKVEFRLNSKDVFTILRKINAESCGGNIGIKNKLLRGWLDLEDTLRIGRELYFLARKMVQMQVPDRVRDYLLNPNLLPILKEKNGDIRPVIYCSSLIRVIDLVAACNMEYIKMRKVIGKTQTISIKRGSDIMMNISQRSEKK